MGLVTLDEVKIHLGMEATTALDARLNLILEGVSEIVVSETGREWDGIQDRVVDAVGSGRPALVLRHAPLTQVSVVRIGTSTLNVGDDDEVDPFIGSADIYADKERGILYRLDGGNLSIDNYVDEGNFSGLGGGPITRVFDAHHFADGPVWPADRTQLIHVEYRGGVDPPAMIKLAVLEIIAWMIQQSGGKKNINACGVSTTLFAGAVNELPAVKQTLSRFEDLARYGHRV